MKANIKFLSVALVVQLVLTAYITFQPGLSKSGADAKESLLNLALVDIDEIQIIGADEPTPNSNANTSTASADGAVTKVLTMRYENGKWTLPNSQRFEANQEKVNQFLEKLAQLKCGWVVASSKEAADRFKVKADDFARKLVFFSKGKTVQTLLIGTTPRFKYAHVRLDSAHNIYEVPFGIHEASISQQDWLNSAYLHRELSDVSNVALPSLKLSRDATKDEQFSVALGQNNLDPAKIDRGKLETLLYRLTHINLQDIISDAEKKTLATLEPKFTYSMQFKTGAVDYKIYELKDKPYYVLAQSSGNWMFKVDKHTVDEIAAVTADNIVLNAPESAVTSAGSEQQQPKQSQVASTDQTPQVVVGDKPQAASVSASTLALDAEEKSQAAVVDQALQAMNEEEKSQDAAAEQALKALQEEKKSQTASKALIAKPKVTVAEATPTAVTKPTTAADPNAKQSKPQTQDKIPQDQLFPDEKLEPEFDKAE